jgi:flavin reductase (DIM6/NTAB) family NADH-FMN oxidoreductase RutF
VSDDEQFGDFMGSVPRPMIVVTVAAGDTRAGCMVGFHSQSSIDPPQYAVWLSKANRTFRIAAFADTFAVHFLDAANRPLAELFGGVTGDEDDKFAHCAWHDGPGGVPLLDDCENRITMRRVAMHDAGGDHACFVLEPLAVETGSSFSALASTELGDIEAGHAAEERQRPR